MSRDGNLKANGTALIRGDAARALVKFDLEMEELEQIPMAREVVGL